MNPTSGTARPRVSVIMIFLDAAAFMEESIESVRQQTLEDWELLLVDDGSTDASSEIARAYETRDRRIRYLEHPRHENRGMSASRNLGIADARGELIAFLEADDIWLPEKLQKQAELLDANPRAAMVYGPTLLWYSWDRGREHSPPDRHRILGVEPDRLYEPPALVPRFLRREAQTPSTCGVLVRREAVARVGGFEDAFHGMYEDQVFFYKLCLSEPVYVTHHCWDWYRQHRASASIRTCTRATPCRPTTIPWWARSSRTARRASRRSAACASRSRRWWSRASRPTSRCTAIS
jgi:glycosyltransferase involved in cell wall biosynthesis